MPPCDQPRCHSRRCAVTVRWSRTNRSRTPPGEVVVISGWMPPSRVDYGEPVDIEAPGPEEVTDFATLTELLTAG